ncbi:MAG: tetratricopeptide repeat protein [Desulfococcaceae bacterium]
MKRKLGLGAISGGLLVGIRIATGAGDGSTPAPLFEGLGDHRHPAATDSKRTQRYFDQGLVLGFGFNHAEAHRSFLQAAEIDPDRAMAWWGAAWVPGPNINAAMDSQNAPKAWRLLRKAKSAAARAGDREKAYIDALAHRYGPEPMDDRSSRGAAFARAMGAVADRYPEDMDARVIYAEALMDLSPWDSWRENGEPKEVTRKILSALNGFLRRAPKHPMANHQKIHAVEAAHPLQRLEEAKRLENLVPGAGHLVHMPAHLYTRVGRYHDATRTNQRAIAADKRHLAQVDAQGAYRLAHVPHNCHFGWATGAFEGRRELALRLSREMADMVDPETMRKRPWTTLQQYWITPLYALVRFGKWDQILAWDSPAEDLPYPRSVWHYARGTAFARRGELDAARDELGKLEQTRKDASLKWATVWDSNKSRHILDIASHVLQGEIAAAGDFEASIEALTHAVAREDALNYDEPPTWHFPTRQALGAVLLETGKPKRAETAYREDLKKYPENGWSLFGPLDALRRQGKTEAAADVERRFREAWRHAEIVLTASRF